MRFHRPDALEVIKALGDIKELPKDMKMALTNVIDESFEPIPMPDNDDWLGIHAEKGQTMLGFKRTLHKAVPDGTRKTIYIQPIGRFDNERTLPFTAIIEFARAFFVGCDLGILPILDFTPEMKCRTNCDGILQYHADGFFDYLSQTRSRRDSTRELLCVALTMADIYAGENWNFIYSQVERRSGLGVLSFARADPLFPASQLQLCEEPVTEEHRIIILRRCVKHLSTVGRLFGLNNCIYYNCFMNNSNHDDELDRKPLYLCPICLRKLYSTLEFDIRLMYETLANLCEKYGLREECAWYRKRLNFIRDSVIVFFSF